MEDLLAYVQSIPEETIAITVYLSGSLVILCCWYAIANRMPRFIGRMSMMTVFAMLLTPTVSEGYNASIAPAVFGLLFGILTKDTRLIWENLAMIMLVIGILSVVAYTWIRYSAKQQSNHVNYDKNKIPPL